jgi:dihydroxycyclohexadiene carboxylate dehydrogenase
MSTAAQPSVYPGRFAGKVALVTGAAQGIGREAAMRLAREGARVVAGDRSDLVYELIHEIEAMGGKAVAVVTDFERYEGATLLVRMAVERFGRADILVNNVGGTIWAKPFVHYEEAQIEKEIQRSLFPTLWCSRAVLPQMIGQGGGAIVNVSSIATRGLHRVPYGAAKGGVNAITACLAWEVAEQGIRVNAVATGGTEAPPRRVARQEGIPLGTQEKAGEAQAAAAWYQTLVDQTLQSSLMHRYGSIAEQVAAILFLASDEASYITGVTLPVAGGDLG